MNFKLRPNQKLSVLIVDDDNDMRESLHDILESFGIFSFIIHSGDGRDAIQKLLYQRFDLVITDLHMPKLEGGSLIEYIKTKPSIRDTYLILVSGNITKEVLDKAVRYEIRDILTKPFSLDRIEKIINNFLINYKNDKVKVS